MLSVTQTHTCMHKPVKTTHKTHKSPQHNDRYFFFFNLTAKLLQLLHFDRNHFWHVVLDDNRHRQTVKQSLLCYEFKHKDWHLRPLEHSRQLAISHYHLHAHTRGCTHTHKQKYCPTLFGQSSRSTTLQISDELLQSPFSVTLQPQFYLAIPWWQLALTCR